MKELSEENIRANCPHCDPNSFALKYPLRETDYFRIVCDVHPLTRGHMLIIPKRHISCLGEFPEEIYNEFLLLYGDCSRFLIKSYGAVSSFEHGKIGQTVFHAHIQIFPYNGSSQDIIPEGSDNLTVFDNINYLKSLFKKAGGYLFFSIGGRKWVVNPGLGIPGFFRNRFAKALHHPERGNWREMRRSGKLMTEAGREINSLIGDWNAYLSGN